MILNINTRVLILGGNGYIGVALYQYLTERGYFVLAVDNETRERNVRSIGGESLTNNKKPSEFDFDVSKDYKSLKEVIKNIRPNVVVNLAQQPSAPFSMIDAGHAVETQGNNNAGNLNLLYMVKEVNPNIHIIQLGTAGEYPDWLYEGIEVPEGSRIDVDYQGKKWNIPTPRYAGSWYHFSKLHSSYNADYAARIWGLRITDINQGIVYGHVEGTRFDYDEYFGTVVNRFVTQAVAGIPLTIYGDKGGQTRSFINLKNSIQAIELLINNPADKGEYRIIQQLTETHKIKSIAEKIQKLTDCEIQYIPNPRAEKDENEFTFAAQELKTLGLKTIGLDEELPLLIDVVKKHKDKIKTEVILPRTTWK